MATIIINSAFAEYVENYWKEQRLEILAFEIKGDKSLWERMDIPHVGEVLLVEESYYDGIVEDVEKLQQEIERLKEEMEARNELQKQKNLLFLQLEKTQKEIERYISALDSIANKGTNVEPKRIVVKMQSIARNTLGNKR